jgi:hypothetical protein
MKKIKTSSLLTLNTTSAPIVLNLLSAAGMDLNTPDLEEVYKTQIQHIMKFHFDREIDLADLKLHRKSQ